MQVNILIVEDEQLIALELAAGLERDGYRVAGIADTFEEARDIFSREVVDIVLMDIHIRGKLDGVDTAAELMRLRAVPIVYLSALVDTKTVERVKGTHPAAFLSKPYSMPNVRIAIELALANFAVARGAVLGAASGGGAAVIRIGGTVGTGGTGAGANGAGANGAGATAADKEMILQLEDSIFVKNNVQFVKIALQDILYLEADNNYVQLYTPERKFALRVSLAQLLEKIQFKKLVRIHRSYAVNIDRMSSFSDGEVWIGKQSLPLGRNYREEFLNKFYFK
ncbi:MAG TPA: response regulator [Puia sp.]|nr:response regulator [Puia sp.]